MLGAVPPAWHPLVTAHVELLAGCLALLRPGATFGDLLEFIKGVQPGSGLTASIQLAGLGYGGDGPLVTSDFTSAGAHALPIKVGNSLALTPIIASADG